MDAQSLIQELTDMNTRFENLKSGVTWEHKEGYVWIDARKLHTFNNLIQQCDTLFNNAERFLAQHKPKYTKMETLMKWAMNPHMYAARCDTLIQNIRRLAIGTGTANR